MTGLPAGNGLYSKPAIVLDLLPHLLRIITPTLKAVRQTVCHCLKLN